MPLGRKVLNYYLGNHTRPVYVLLNLQVDHLLMLLDIETHYIYQLIYNMATKHIHKCIPSLL